MNISRGFLLAGAVYLLVGIGLGAHMGASGDHSLSPVHAHINLLGFTLMTLFGLAYRLIPGLNAGWLGRAQFWLHQIGGLILLIALYLLMSGTLPPETVGPVMPVAEIMVLLSAIFWLVNLWRAAR